MPLVIGVFCLSIKKILLLELSRQGSETVHGLGLVHLHYTKNNNWKKIALDLSAKTVKSVKNKILAHSVKQA
jgi:hypothetical protein